MKASRVFLYTLLVVIVMVNIILLGLTFMYGGIAEGVYEAVLTDRPEFSQLDDTLLSAINIVSSILVIVGTVLPVVLLLMSKGAIKGKQTLVICLSLIPIFFLMVKLLIFPEPDSFTQSSMGGYQVRTYVWTTSNDTVVKSWISEKPFTAYKNQERIKWIPLEEKQ